MCGRYTLEWLDSLITVSLNPAKTDVSAINDEQIEAVISRMAEEKDRLQSLLKDHVFGLTKEKQIELFLKKYHSALVILLDQASENHKSIPTKKSLLKQLAKEIITCLDELLSFIEVRFSDYLCLDERVPVTYLSVIKKELKLRANKLKDKFNKQRTNPWVMDIVFKTIYSFVNPPTENYPATFQEVLYLKELIKELETLEETSNKNHIYSSLDVLLIYLDFNSKEYKNYLTQCIADKINTYESLSAKMDCLLFHSKEFNQMHRKAGTALYPQQIDLKDELSNWFTQEIFYLEKKLHLSIVPLNGKTENIKEKPPHANEKAKVLCILSTDQTGLVLRAADELKILMARSMNEVFKTIVPHLSTPYKENLSYDSMRSKSYAAEERDKKIAIETLEKIIEKIKEY
jgi:dsDNA-binding SOS-regulon protein